MAETGFRAMADTEHCRMQGYRLHQVRIQGYSLIGAKTLLNIGSTFHLSQNTAEYRKTSHVRHRKLQGQHIKTVRTGYRTLLDTCYDSAGYWTTSFSRYRPVGCRDTSSTDTEHNRILRDTRRTRYITLLVTVIQVD
jgi:hypothetical protein